MLLYVAGVLFTLFIAYVLYILLPSTGSDYEDNSINAFITQSAESDGAIVNKSTDDQYTRQYDEPGKQILIVYGTEYGFSEEVARTLFDKIEAEMPKDEPSPWQPRIVDAKHHEFVDFCQEHLMFVVISTAGDGIPPTEARPLCCRLEQMTTDLRHLCYSVLSLGDTNYPYFCKAGKTVDQRLQSLGAKQVVPRHDVDMEDWSVINTWMDKVLLTLDIVRIEPEMDYLKIELSDTDSGPSRTKPFMSKITVKRNLTTTVCEGDKETIHCEFDLTDSGIVWTSGDALGIYPQNHPGEVSRLLAAMACTGSERIDVPKSAYQPKPEYQIDLRTSLQMYYDLKNVKPELLQSLSSKATGTEHAQELVNLLKAGTSKQNTFLHEYLYEREVADVLEDFHAAATKLSASDVLGQMKALQPRYYSISSSPILDAECCCVTAAIVRYTTLGISRTGVTTTFLQDRLHVGESCPVFISQNPEFRLPDSGSVPVIMVGPGTGIAPFRAFIQERVKNKAAGRNRLYFGCRHKEGDFLYKEELENLANEGQIELRTAFSRDQQHKIYVQDLIRDDCDLIWSLIKEHNAHIYICGDAKHMAHDVHKELMKIAQSHGNMTDSEAAAYFLTLEAQGRYQKDVWVT